MELVAAHVRAVGELRALRDSIDPSTHLEWVRAVHEAGTILVRAGRAKP
jgi:hypothetical protein